MRPSIKGIVKSLFLFYLFVYLVTLPAISFAATLFVNATLATTCKPTVACSSDCYNTISAAISGASNGDTIYICANGTVPHVAASGIDKSLNIYGNQSGVEVGSGGSSGRIFQLNANGMNISNLSISANASDGGIRFNGNNSRLYGNTIKHIGGPQNIVINAVNITIEHNNMTNVTNDNIVFIEGAAVAGNWFVINNNTIYNINGAGISYGGPSPLNITNNIIYEVNTSQIAIEISEGGNNSYIFNNNITGTIQFDTNSGINVTNNIINGTSMGHSVHIKGNAANLTFRDNTVFGATSINLNISQSSFINITNNTIYNSSAGIVLTDSRNINLINNTLRNHTVAQIQLNDSSTATLIGNQVLQTPSGAFDLRLLGGSNATTLIGSTYYNFSNENLTIFFGGATDISIKFMTNNSAGAAKSLCSPSSVSSNTLSKDCNLVNFNGFNTIVNITSNSGSATIDLGIYFNTSDGSDSTGGSVQIARYSTGWLEAGRSAYDGTVGSVRFDEITSFSLFGAVWFRETTASSGAATSVQPLSIESSILTCPGNLLELVATSKGSAVSDVLVRLILYEPYNGFKQEKLTNAEGKANFNLTNEKDGKYQLDSSKTGYQKPTDVLFDFVHCAVEQPKNETVEIKKEEPEPIIELEPSSNITSSVPISQPEPVKAKEIKPESNVEEPKPEQPKEESSEEQKSGGLDIGQIVLGLATVGVVGFAVYKLFAKKGYSGFKK